MMHAPEIKLSLMVHAVQGAMIKRNSLPVPRRVVISLINAANPSNAKTAELHNASRAHVENRGRHPSAIKQLTAIV